MRQFDNSFWVSFWLGQNIEDIDDFDDKSIDGDDPEHMLTKEEIAKYHFGGDSKIDDLNHQKSLKEIY